MSINLQRLRDTFPYGVEVWDELEKRVSAFCPHSCPECPLRGPIGDQARAYFNSVFQDAYMPSSTAMCSRTGMFSCAEQIAAIVGCQLPGVSDDNASLPDCEVSFAGLFGA